MPVSIADLNNGLDPSQLGTLGGRKVTYTGKNPLHPLRNGISDSFKVDIVAGSTLIVCKNQFIDYRDFDPSGKGEGQLVLRCHFNLVGIGEHTNCSCGACGFVWHFEKVEECSCEQKPPLDPGKQPCVIM